MNTLTHHHPNNNFTYAMKHDASHWPGWNPFHPGEVSLQRRMGVHDSVMGYAPKFIRPYLPEQHVLFYEHQPFLVAAARDDHGNMWSTLLTGPAGQDALFVERFRPDPAAAATTTTEPITQLLLHGGPTRTDALYGQLTPGTDLGLLGIEFATQRRNRVNGRITSVDESKNSWTFHVDQSFGNCPQYIKPRQWWWSIGETTTMDARKKKNATTRQQGAGGSSDCQNAITELTSEQVEMISNAETIFVATGYRGKGEDVRYGNDASHRGGPKGFVMVQNDGRTLILPDFAGNNHFNTLGNLQMDPRMGITFPDFEYGGMLQLSGRARVEMDRETSSSMYPGALRLIIFDIEQINVVPRGSLPIRWSTSDSEERTVQIAAIVQESKAVKSFYLQPLPQDKRSLWPFQAGQHLPIGLVTDDGVEVWRTYSLSGSPYAKDCYRLSVKREDFGLASRILHDKIEEGHVVKIRRPAGDFVLSSANNTVEEHRAMKTNSSDLVSTTDPTLVLLSAGIGLTPLLSMLHEVVVLDPSATSRSNSGKTRPFFSTSRPRRRRVLWMHAARDGEHHALHSEVLNLQDMAENKHIQLDTHVRYSQEPRVLDDDNRMSSSSFDSLGRIDAQLLESMIPNETERRNAIYYICGPKEFLSSMERNLEILGANSDRIHMESF